MLMFTIGQPYGSTFAKFAGCGSGVHDVALIIIKNSGCDITI